MGNVAGESSTVIYIPQGNVKYQAQRKESRNLINSTIYLSEVTTIDIRLLPEDVTDLETVDVEVRGWFMVFNATFSNISVILWQSVLLVTETGIPGENHRPVASL